MLFLYAAICGESENPVALLKLVILPNVAPPFLLTLKYMSLLLFAVALACHTIYTLFSYAAICGRDDNLVLLLMSALCPKESVYMCRGGIVTTTTTKTIII